MEFVARFLLFACGGRCSSFDFSTQIRLAVALFLDSFILEVMFYKSYICDRAKRLPEAFKVSNSPTTLLMGKS